MCYPQEKWGKTLHVGNNQGGGRGSAPDADLADEGDRNPRLEVLLRPGGWQRTQHEECSLRLDLDPAEDETKLPGRHPGQAAACFGRASDAPSASVDDEESSALAQAEFFARAQRSPLQALRGRGTGECAGKQERRECTSGCSATAPER